MALQDKQVLEEAFRFILGSTLVLHLPSNIFFAFVEPVSNQYLIFCSNMCGHELF